MRIAGVFPISSASTIDRAINTMMTVEEFDLESAATYDQWKAEQEAEWFGVREQIEAEWAASASLTKPMFEVLPARDTNGRWVWALLEIA
ncbi:hypothetical protein [Bradyrhizobium sp. CCBAU 11357]|uniref:hypothetical protein n=1 Tax=Bradyrhizobium sp. CCBAU 11357 TaxID=1630808 RepID=UPI0023025DD9|nr:hypothetical protein [Bradyrhizobium sp. CCBAU 11357]